MSEFKAWPKTPRLNKNMVVTEKIDGTNACVNIQPATPVLRADGSEYPGNPRLFPGETVGMHEIEGILYVVTAQSRNRVITPGDDNYGFAGWVQGNAQALVETLGAGYHFGEWWGSGINRGYGYSNGERFFSLFNTAKWSGVDLSAVPNMRVVPVLYEGEFDTERVRYELGELLDGGSYVAPDYMNPEGVCVYHEAARQVFKLLPDPLPKSLTQADVVTVA